MEEIVIKLDIPPEMKEIFESSLKESLEKAMLNLEFSILRQIMSKSKLTDEHVNKLADELKEKVAKRHGL